MKVAYAKIVFIILAVFAFKIAIADSIRTKDFKRNPSSQNIQVQTSF
ncbi:hypothetical protein M899_2166 [Bacteriovorax sp. BSW11_IV]|nr:hypothetical protein [Bacteriovorax sp. BSW11_IV]EQC47792.1 hypothetical protein M899_2166 [Bacteriovorax sp. BSW11_IV]